MIARKAPALLTRLAACLATSLATGAPAETLALPCAPPAGKRFTLIHEQHGWTQAGAPSRVTFSRALRFERDGKGVLMVLGPARATSNLTGAEARRLAALYAPGGEREARMRLDGQGRITAIDAIEGHWRDYIARLERLAALVEAEGGAAARTRATIAALTGADEATKMAAVDGEVVPFLRFCGQAVEGIAADGTGGEDRMIAIVEQEEGNGATAEIRYRASRASGLVMTIDRRLTPAAQPDRPLVEHWRLEPGAP